MASRVSWRCEGGGTESNGGGLAPSLLPRTKAARKRRRADRDRDRSDGLPLAFWFDSTMDAANSSATSYIPMTTQEARHYVQQGSSVVSLAPSVSALAVSGNPGQGGDLYEDPGGAPSTSASSTPPAGPPPPPSYVLSSGHEAVVPSHGAAVQGLQLPQNPAVEGQVGQPPAYQLDLQHGISTLTAPGGGGGHHPHYPDVWLSGGVPHELKGSIPNSVPLPPVSEVHPSRGPKLAPRLAESASAAVQQRRSMDEADRQSSLHSYLNHVLPNIQDPVVVKVPATVASLPPHHDHLLSVTTAELLADATSAVVSSLDRVSNIYSIAPSQAAAVSGSHALTLDTSVHTQFSALMQHHSHDCHFPGSLIHLGLGLEVEMDKHQVQQQHAIGSSIAMTTADISCVMAEHRGPILDGFGVVYGGELAAQKHDHVSQEDGAARLMAAAVVAHHPGIHLQQDLGSMQLQEAGGEAKDLVETLACYRCKVCPFISFSKEGVEQHVRAAHLKQEADAGEAPPPSREDAVPELCAQEIEIHQQQAVVEDDPEQGKENTYICGMCDRGFTDIESCGVHMAVDHNLPVDQVHLEPLPAMPMQEAQPPPLQEPRASLQQQQQQQHQTRPLQPLLPAPASSQPPALHGRPDDGQRQAQAQEQRAMEAAKPKAARRRKVAKKLPRDGEDLGGGAAAAEDERGGDCVTIKQESDEKRDGGSAGADNQDSCGEANADSADSSLNNAVGGKSGAKKRGRPRGSKTLGITALKKKNRASKAAEDHLLGFRCDVHGCAVRMQSLENLEYHRKCHTDDVEHFECPECNLRYDNWKSTSVHLWRTHVVDMELYSCDLCSYKTYSYGKLMNMHRRIHSDERLFMCDVCGRCFKTNKQLRNHKVIHLDKRKNRSFRSGECDICNRHFSDKRMLRVHKDTVHNKLRPYLCQYCSYTASCRSTLKMHIRQHTGEKPFACEMCDYRTADHNSLRRHKMRHSGEKPYKCPFCPYKSIQSSTYKTHLKNKHPGLDEGLLFSCDHCPFRTIKRENYVTHMADHKNGGLPQQGVAGQQNHGALPPAAATASHAYFSPHPQSSAAASSTALQPQMEVVPFIFSVPDEMRQRNSQQQIYAVVDSDNPEERFPILASQLKIGQRGEDEEHILPHASMASAETGCHVQIMSSQETGSAADHAGEAVSHAQLTPVPPETILPN